jgi:hypothetical protein
MKLHATVPCDLTQGDPLQAEANSRIATIQVPRDGLQDELIEWCVCYLACCDSRSFGDLVSHSSNNWLLLSTS